MSTTKGLSYSPSGETEEGQNPVSNIKAEPRQNPISTIKAELRAAMNGVASRTIRESGMGYRLVFGVELPRLREIAADYQSDGTPEGNTRARRLALALWMEDIRECKLLAILLYPAADFDRDMADLWLEDLRPEQAEVAQLLSMQLLCRMPQAADQAFLLMADERPLRQLCGFLSLTRLLMQGSQLSPDAEAEFLDQAAATLPTDYRPLRKAVANALLHYGQTSHEAGQKAEYILCN